MGFLYGAAVQGIQSFIFETNKLQEIVGASELVEEIVTELYKDFIDENKVDTILSAAGNLKLFSKNKEVLEQIVKEFPRAVMLKAPGISISQAVVDIKANSLSGIESEDIEILEMKLKAERNINTIPLEVSGLAVSRSPKTGKSAVKRDSKDGLLDKSSVLKRKASVNSKVISKINATLMSDDDSKKREPRLFTHNIDDFAGYNSWIAVIHADGNSLGKAIREFSSNKNQYNVDNFKEFSQNLDLSTREAANYAFNEVIVKDFKTQKLKNYQLRPIILGGDDLTVICRADLAIDFTKQYLKKFQELTQNYLKKKITACAGIAFMKENYPFHYGVDMAEVLCGVAKKKSKEINADVVPASIAFHKIQSSFIDSYSTIVERELTARDNNNNETKFNYGPYSIEHITGMAHLEELIKKVKTIEEDSAPKAGVRKWLSLLHEDRIKADNLLTRVREITKQVYVDKLGLSTPIDTNSKTILHDVLAISSLKGE